MSACAMTLAMMVIGDSNFCLSSEPSNMRGGGMRGEERSGTGWKARDAGTKTTAKMEIMWPGRRAG